MATSVIKNQEVFLDAYRLTTRLNSVKLDYGCEAQDDTTLGDANRSNMGGLKMATAAVEGFYDATPYDAALFSLMGLADKAFSVATGNTQGDLAYFFKAMEADYAPIRNGVGEIISFSAGAMTTKSPLIRGIMAIFSSSLTATGNGTAIQLGAVAAGQKIYAASHVWSVSGGTPSCTFILQSDDNSGFSSATTRSTFTAATNITSEWKEVSGAITDDYWRVNRTISGSTPVFGAAVFIGII